MPLSSSNAVRELSDYNSQGTRLGRSASDLISFYGATPQTQPAGATSNVSLTATSYTVSTAVGSTAGVGFSTAALFASSVAIQAQLVVDMINVQRNLNALHRAASSSGFTAGA